MRVQGHRPTSSPRRSMPGLAFAVALATSGCGGAAAPAATAVPADDPAVAEAGRFVEGFFEAYLTEAGTRNSYRQRRPVFLAPTDSAGFASRE